MKNSLPKLLIAMLFALLAQQQTTYAVTSAGSVNPFRVGNPSRKVAVSEFVQAARAARNGNTAQWSALNVMPFWAYVEIIRKQAIADGQYMTADEVADMLCSYGGELKIEARHLSVGIHIYGTLNGGYDYYILNKDCDEAVLTFEKVDQSGKKVQIDIAIWKCFNPFTVSLHYPFTCPACPKCPEQPNPDQPTSYDYHQYDKYHHYPNQHREEFAYYDNTIRDWRWIPQPRLPRWGVAYIMPWDLFLRCFPTAPRFCCWRGGVRYGMCCKTPQTERVVNQNNYNITVNVTVNNSTTVNNTINIIQEVPRPEQPRPTPMYNNTGGAGDVTASNTDGGGGDTPGGSGTTGGSGTDGDNTGASGEFVGKKEQTNGWHQVDPRGNEQSRPVTQNQQNRPATNTTPYNSYDDYLNQPGPEFVQEQRNTFSGQNNGSFQQSNVPGNTLANGNPNYGNSFGNTNWNQQYYGNQNQAMGQNFQGTGIISGNANQYSGQSSANMYGNQTNTGIGNGGSNTTNSTYNYTFNGGTTNSGAVTQTETNRPQGGSGNSGTIYYDQNRPATQGSASFSGGQPEQGRPGQGIGNIPGRR